MPPHAIDHGSGALAIQLLADHAGTANALLPHARALRERGGHRFWARRAPGTFAYPLPGIGRRSWACGREEADVRLWGHDVDPREGGAGCSDEDPLAREDLHACDLAGRRSERHRASPVERRTGFADSDGSAAA